MTAIHGTSRSALALIAAAGVGIGAGSLTASLQGELAAGWGTVADSGAIWTLVAALAAGVLARHRTTAMSAGMLVLLGEVVGYYAYVTDVRHLPVLPAEETLWTVAALWIGPLAGLAAFAVRWGSARHRVLALLAFCGAVGGEGAYLWRVADVRAAGIVELVAAGAGAVVALIAVPADVRLRIVATLSGVAVGAGVFVAYAQPLIA